MNVPLEDQSGLPLFLGPELSAEQARELLREGELAIEGRLIDASNATLIGTVARDGVSRVCVHKPVAGERPLWDFPDGTLAGREVAAYLISESTGWDVVPPTVLREGPYGPGMCQLWVDPDDTVDLVRLARSRHPDLRKMVLFDAVVNNTDRKGTHLLPTAGAARVYGCDHGLTFHRQDKLRTVLWRYAGKAYDAEEREVLEGLRTALTFDLGEQLEELITRREVAVTRMRVERLLDTGCFPQPSDDWPPVPYPPF